MKDRWLTAAARVAGVVLVLSALLNGLVVVARIHGMMPDNDFRLYYAGAEVGLQHGWSHVHERQYHEAAVAALNPPGKWYALLTPAPVTLLVAPLTLLGYPAAYYAWIGLLVLLTAATFWILRPRSIPAWLFFPWAAALGPIGFSIFEGQVTVLVGLCLAGTWALLRARRPFLAGLVLAPAFLKPHLVLLVPVCLILTNHWRAVAGLAVAGGAGAILTLAMLGPQGTRDYLSMLTAPQPSSDQIGTLAWLLGGGLVGAAARVLAAGLGALAAYRARRAGPHVTIAIGVVASFLAASYWHPQDYLGIEVAALLLLSEGVTAIAIAFAAAVFVLSWPLAPTLANFYYSPAVAWAWILAVASVLVIYTVTGAGRVARPPRRSNAEAGASSTPLGAAAFDPGPPSSSARRPR